MHLTRNNIAKKFPLLRKGTKYIAVARGNRENSVPVVIAVRDMLKLARTAKEVDAMIKQKLLKINGKIVYDYHESINLFSIFEADKSYQLTISPTKRFTFVVTKKNEIISKVTNKHLFKGKKTQLNLSDGTNVLGDNKIQVGDSLVLDFKGKIVQHISLEKGKNVFILKGQYMGQSGKIQSVEENKVKIKFEDKEATLDKTSVLVQWKQKLKQKQQK